MKKAAFSLDKFSFNQVLIDMDKYTDSEIKIDFNSSGIYFKGENRYELNLVFKALHDEKDKENFFIRVNCKSFFTFNEETKTEGIPDFFYRNSIAIVYPFIRSFISSLTLQANIKLILLPTMNLISLEAPLKENTIVQE
jgi:preprotein translocase subunit SecB